MPNLPSIDDIYANFDDEFGGDNYERGMIDNAMEAANLTPFRHPADIDDRNAPGYDASGRPHTTDHRTTTRAAGGVELAGPSNFDARYNSSPELRAARNTGISSALNTVMASNSMSQVLPPDSRAFDGDSFGFQDQGRSFVNLNNDRTLLNQQQVGQAFNSARTVLQSSMAGTHGMSDENVFGTIVKNMNKELVKHYSEQFKNAGSTAEADTVKSLQLATKKIMNHMVDSAVRAIGADGGTVASVRGMVYDHTQSMRGMDAAQARDFLAVQPEAIQSAVNQYGLERAMQSPNELVFGDQETSTGVSIGGGGGSWGGGRGGGGGIGGQGIWGSGVGRAMHAMYIGRRMWNYTGGLVTKGSQQYVEDQAAYSGLYRQAIGDPIGTVYGAQARQEEMQGMLAEAAYGQVGALGDFGYMMAGSDNADMGARLVSGAGLAAGAGAVLRTAGVALGSAGLASVAAPVAGVLAGTFILNEIDNIMTGDNRGASQKWSDAFVQSAGIRATTKALKEAGLVGGSVSPEQQAQQMRMLGVTEADVLAQFGNENVANMWSGLGGAAFQALKDSADDAASNTGGDKQKTIDMATLLAEQTGSVGYTQRILNQVGGMEGVSEENLGAIMTMAQQAGLGPGDAAGIYQISSEYSQLDTAGQAQYRERQAGYAQVGSMLGNYMGSVSAGQRLASEHKLSFGAGRNLQSYMAAGTRFGADMNEILSYEMSRVEGTTVVTPITRADAIAMRAKERTQYQASIDVGVGNIFMKAGMGFNEAMNQAEIHGFESESQVGTFSSWMKTSESFRGPMNEYETGRIAELSGMQSGAQGAMIGRVAERMAIGGYDAFELLSGQGLSDQQMFQTTSAMRGDFGAASYLANQGVSAFDSMGVLDDAGRSNLMYDGAGAMRLAAAQPASNRYAGDFQAAYGRLDERQQGIFDAGGLSGLQKDFRRRARGLQGASIGLGYARIAEQQAYLWGQDQGGSWDDPTRGSLWGMQDVQRQMRHESTLAGFGMQRRRMDLNQEFAASSEDLQGRRMGVTQGYQTWQSGFNRQSALMQRGFMAQGWAAQDQMSDLQFGWQMEDLDENIRMSGGRERRQLVDKKERSVLMRNLQEQQKETVRGNQEAVWAREDERYEKQSEYQTNLQEMEKEQFAMQVDRRMKITELDEEDFTRKQEEYEEMRKLNEEMIELQREHQKKQIDFQLQALGIQSAQLALQQEEEEKVGDLKESYEGMVGFQEQLQRYDPELALAPVVELLEVASNVDIHKISRLAEMIRSTGSINTTKVTILKHLMEDAY